MASVATLSGPTGTHLVSVPIQEQEGWELLRTHLALADRFSLIVLTAPDEATLNQVRLELKTAVGPDQPRHEIVFQPFAPPRTLTEQILDKQHAAPPLHYLWVSAPASIHDPEAVDLRAWREAFTYLNHHRNRLRKEIPGTLILAGTPETLATLREYAPDLWSIRSALIQFSSGSMSAPAIRTLAGEVSLKLDELIGGLGPSSRLAAYKRALLAAFSAYQELALDNFAAADQTCPDIWDIFVHPACAENHLRPEEMDAAQREKPPRLPAADLLPLLAQDDHRRTVLLADPGMGKSTLIQALIAHLASGRPLSGAPALTGLLPVPLILRDLVPLLPQDQVAGWTWDSLLTVLIEHYQREETAPLLCEAFKGHEAEFRQFIHTDAKVFFLIDGLDEIGDLAKRQKIVQCIQEGIRAVSNEARWLITSRVIGYEDAPVHFVSRQFKMNLIDKTVPRSQHGLPWATAERGKKEFIIEWQDWMLPGTGWDEDDDTKRESSIPDDDTEFDEWPVFPSHQPLLKGFGTSYFCRLPIAQRLYLAPFDDKRQDAFASRWFRHRHSTDHSRELMREVRAHHHDGVRIISRVPNLLCMMNMLKRSGKPLPDGRAALYDEIVKAYLGGIESAYKHKPILGLICPFDPPGRRFLLSLLGAHMQHARSMHMQSTPETGEIEEAEAGVEMEGGSYGTDGNILISRPQLDQLLCPAIQRMCDEGRVSSQHSASKLLDELLHHIASRSGLLIPRSSDAEGNTVYGFTHLSFLEFFAAEWLGKEFDRQRNRIVRRAEATSEGQDLTEAELDSEFPPAGPIHHPRDTFEHLPSQPVWHEPLIFLLESRKADAPTLLRWLFPALHSANREQRTENQEPAKPLLPLDAVRLLVKLTADPEIPISSDKRQAWWFILWDAYLSWPHLAWESRDEKNWPIASLLLERTEHRQEVLDALIAVLPAHPRKLLVLYECTTLSSEDLRCFAGVDGLLHLSLAHCTGLKDTAWLASLRQLEILDLGHCSGLKGSQAFQGLAGMKKLKTLNLFNCPGLIDTAPLAELSELETLDLGLCTGLHGSDALHGLENLSALRELYLTNCTSIEILPNLRSHHALRLLNLTGCRKLKNLDEVRRQLHPACVVIEPHGRRL